MKLYIYQMAIDPFQTGDSENHPTIPSVYSGAKEMELYHKRLAEDAPRLFTGQGDIEAWFHNGQGKSEWSRKMAHIFF